MNHLTKNFLEYFFLFGILMLPLYIFSFNLFGIPTNVSETIIVFYLSFFVALKRKTILENIQSLPSWYTLSIFLIFLGIISSILYPGNFSLHGLGIIKGWFVLPVLFSFSGFMLFKKDSFFKIFYAIYSSSFFVALSSIIYLFQKNLTFDGRLKAFYLSPNQLSMFLIFSFFIFPLIMTKMKSSFSKILLVISFIPIIISTYLTFSYSVWISAFISIIFSAILIGDFFFKKNGTVLMVLSIFVLFVFFQINNQKMLSVFNERSSLYSRVMIWKSSFKIATDNPLFGIGPGNFQKKYLEYQKFFPPYLEWAVPHPHSLYFSFWLQAGILGLIGVVIMLFKSILFLVSNKKTAFSAALLVSILYISIHGIFDTTVWKNDLSYLFWLFILMIPSTENQKSSL